MPKQHNVFHLTNREIDILNILWNTQNPMIASEITKQDSTLTINTVQVNLRKLIKKGLIEVADIVYSGTVLCRSYRPTVSPNEFALQEFSAHLKKFDKSVTTANLVATYIEQEEDSDAVLKEIDKLESILKEKKKMLKKGKEES